MGGGGGEWFHWEAVNSSSSATEGGVSKLDTPDSGITFASVSPKPVSLAARASRPTVTLLSAARTSAGERVNLSARCNNEVAADLGDDGQAVVCWLQFVLWKVVSE